ncbi:MAG: hypothetical protein AAGG38_14235, partial [Planctomycetota bacterium]
MYELTCPSCRGVRRSPFVRQGAATRCPSCGHVWRISEAHLTRVKGVLSGDVPEPRDAMKADPPGGSGRPPETADPAPEDAKGGSSVTGLSGLSEIMQAEPMPLMPSDPGVSVPEGKLVPPGGPTTPATHVPPPRNPGWRMLAVLALALTAGAVILGLVLFGGRGDDRGPTPEPAAGSGSGSGSDHDAVLDADPASGLTPQGPPAPPTPP